MEDIVRNVSTVDYSGYYGVAKKLRGIFIWLDIRTLLVAIWRLALFLFDWRSMLRMVMEKPVLDAVFISNLRDQVDRSRMFVKWSPRDGFINGPRFWINGTAGRTIALNTITEELENELGRQKAKEQFMNACRFAEKNGANVVLLAASTKRLFGDGEELKRLFPNLLFTLGDMGTALILKNEVFRTLYKYKLEPEKSRMAVLGPYGILGRVIVKVLKDNGYNVVGFGPNREKLEKISEEFGIEICHSFSEMGKVDMVISCTHSRKARLTAYSVELIRREDKKLSVIDVAEPSNFSWKEYEKCSNVVIRQDAGNAYSKKLKYVLGFISYKMFRLTRGVAFGCFAEAMSISHNLKHGDGEAKKVDWFSVDADNIKDVRKLYERVNFQLPTPRCFGKKVRSQSLEIES